VPRELPWLSETNPCAVPPQGAKHGQVGKPTPPHARHRPPTTPEGATPNEIYFNRFPANRLIEPDENIGRCAGEILRDERLGGLLKYYRREAA
jgi:hypothetical protein